MAILSLEWLLYRLGRVLGRPVTFDDVLAMYRKGAVEEAYAALSDAIQIAPKLSKYGDICTMRAQLELLVNNNASMALELLEKAKELDNMDDMVHYYNVRGDVMLELGKGEEALQNYEQSVGIDPTVPNLQIFGRALSEMNDSRAVAVWQQALEKDPANVMAHIFSGIEAAKSDDRDKALLMAEKAEKLGPSSEEFYLLAFLYTRLDKFAIALDACHKARKMGYEGKTLLFATIAACHFALGRIKEGRKHALRALRYNPDHEYANEVWREYKKRYEP